VFFWGNLKFYKWILDIYFCPFWENPPENLEKNVHSLHHVERKNGGEKKLWRDLMEGAKIALFWPIFKGFKHILVSIIIAYYAQKNMLR
jgi:hypothetical protein